MSQGQPIHEMGTLGLGMVDHRAFCARPARRIVQDLHGPFLGDNAVWPAPYRHAYNSGAFHQSVLEDCGACADTLWSHGTLVQVQSQALKDTLLQTWGEARVEQATVGPVSIPPISQDDRTRMKQFCDRGWLRLLVRAFEHVGCKAAHVGSLSTEGLAPHGALGAAVLAATTRHRLAVLEELLVSYDGQAHRLFGDLDGLDRTLDNLAGDRSWIMDQVPDHCHRLWPLRNLMRMADRRGVLFRDVAWQEYEDENTYAPELPILALEPDIYGAAIEHDIMHYLGPVFFSPERVPFEIGNNGGEGDAQAMNNLILASRYEGPDYEGYAGWPGAELFEWLEGAFQVPSIPQIVAALRTFTIVLHREFTGDRLAVLQELVPSVQDGEHLAGLLKFYPGYVQHDHDFLGAMHPRYITPLFERWRQVLGGQVTDDLNDFVTHSNDILWELEDFDLRTWNHPIRGHVSHGRELNRLTLKKFIELEHMLELVGQEAATHTEVLSRVMEEATALEARWTTLHEKAGDLIDHVPPHLHDKDELDHLEDIRATLALESDALSEKLRILVLNLGKAQADWTRAGPTLTASFLAPEQELFRGYYYTPAVHVGSDDSPEPKRLGEYESTT